MSILMPPLLRSAQLKQDVTITDADSDDKGNDTNDESVETIIVGDKKIGIRTSILEEKATECNMLCCYADELKDGFYPWIDQLCRSYYVRESLLWRRGSVGKK